jgi:hypothetical protein
VSTFVVVWMAVVFAAHGGYLGIAPWVRRRPVRVTQATSTALVASAVVPGLAYFGFQWMRGALVVSPRELLTLALIVVVGGLFANARRGSDVFFGATADAFRTAWAEALGRLGLAYEPVVGGSGRVERVVLDGVELELRHGMVRGRGAAGREVAAEVAEAIDHYFDTHDTPVDRSGTAMQLASTLLILVLIALSFLP